VIPPARALKSVGEWNSEEVFARGFHIQVILNGTVIVDGDITEASRTAPIDHNKHPGLEAVRAHRVLSHDTVVRFRNIRHQKTVTGLPRTYPPASSFGESGKRQPFAISYSFFSAAGRFRKKLQGRFGFALFSGSLLRTGPGRRARSPAAIFDLELDFTSGAPILMESHHRLVVARQGSKNRLARVFSTVPGQNRSACSTG